MKTMEWTTVDKSKWGIGAWMNEPDKRQWSDPATGLPCLIVRGPLGALCGYVGVAEGHKFYAKNYDAVDVDCHGGLTFSNTCADVEEAEEGKYICHVAESGEPAKVWWLGFDCGHFMDETPGSTYCRDGIYRDIAYVAGEVTSLAKQLSAVANATTPPQASKDVATPPPPEVATRPEARLTPDNT